MRNERRPNIGRTKGKDGMPGTASYLYRMETRLSTTGTEYQGYFRAPRVLHDHRSFRGRSEPYLEGASSINHGHQLAGFAFVVAFLTTMIFFMTVNLFC